MLQELPHWWEWKLELSDHIQLRMVDRNFSEADLRTMINDATEMRPALDDGRWQIISRFEGGSWKIIVETNESDQILVAITAFSFLTG